MMAIIMADMLPGNILLLISISLFTLFHLLIIPVESRLVDTNLDVNKNLFELIKSEGLTKFAGFIEQGRAIESFTSDIRRTVFAFTDTAYYNLPPERKNEIEAMNENDMENFVKFFTVYNSEVTTNNIHDNSKLNSNGKNQNILYTSKQRLNINSDNTEQIYINGALIIRPNLVATNGIIHIIDNVLQITSNNRVIEYLKNPDDSRVKTQEFYDLIGSSPSLRDMLNAEERLTLFVPSDSALKNVNQEKLQQLKSDKITLEKAIDKSMIKNMVIFSSFADFRIRGSPTETVPLLYKNSFDQVSVISEDSTANIVIGNITVANGVIHVVDKLLGFVFNTVMEQIRNDDSVTKFVSLLSQINIMIINEALKTDNAVTLFVPTNEAFKRVAEQTKTLTYNTRCLEEIIKFHIISDVKWQLIVTGGEYDSRESMRSMAGSYLKVYNFDYSLYVDGAGVKARLVSTDIGCTNGLVQKIDRVFGIPDMDIPSLIYNHPWLQMQPFAALRITGLQQLLTNDKRVYDNRNNQFLSANYRQCGFQKCDFTVLIPNGTAIEIMMRNNIGKEIWKNTKILTYVMKRMIFTDKCIFMESMADGIKNIVSSVGIPVLFQKYGASRTVRFGPKVAKVLHADLAATNGVVHIIDQVLWMNSDLESGNTAGLHFSIALTIISIILSCMFI